MSVKSEANRAIDPVKDAIKALHDATSPDGSDYEDYRRKYIPRLMGYEIRLRELLIEMEA